MIDVLLYGVWEPETGDYPEWQHDAEQYELGDRAYLWYEGANPIGGYTGWRLLARELLWAVGWNPTEISVMMLVNGWKGAAR